MRLVTAPFSSCCLRQYEREKIFFDNGCYKNWYMYTLGNIKIKVLFFLISECRKIIKKKTVCCLVRRRRLLLNWRRCPTRFFGRRWFTRFFRWCGLLNWRWFIRLIRRCRLLSRCCRFIRFFWRRRLLNRRRWLNDGWWTRSLWGASLFHLVVIRS